jgi:hypothetical protein
MSWVFHIFEPWSIVIGQIVNLLPNLEVCVCFQKLKQAMHEALIYIQYTNTCATCTKECILIIKMMDKKQYNLKYKKNKNVHTNKKNTTIR